jgi:hypothetical protein
MLIQVLMLNVHFVLVKYYSLLFNRVHQWKVSETKFFSTLNSRSILATIRTASYKQRLDELRDYLINNSAKPLLQTYMEEFKKKQAALDASITKEGKRGKQPSHSATTHSLVNNDTLVLSRYFPLVFFAEQFLARSLKILAQSRSNLIRFDGSSMFDRNWVQTLCLK